MREEWPEHGPQIDGADNAEAAQCDLVVVATPWDGVVSTLKPLAAPLAGKVVISMVNALVKEGREMLALVPPRGSMAAAIQAALPDSLVSAAFHHLPASELEEPRCRPRGRRAGLLGPRRRHAGDGGPDRCHRGSAGARRRELSQAAAIEAFTAVCITLNIRYKAHSTLDLAGFDS